MITINLNNFIAHVFINNLFDSQILSNPSIVEQLNLQTYPRGIVEIIETFGNISKIEIYDLNNNLVLSSEYGIE